MHNKIILVKVSYNMFTSYFTSGHFHWWKYH